MERNQPRARLHAALATGMDEEKTVWSGSSSQMTNLHIYLLCALLCVLIVPVFYAIWRWILLRSRVYEVTSQRIRIRQGVFTRRTDELELYRAKDTTLIEPFWPRLFGLGTIVVTTTDTTTPLLEIQGIPQAHELREHIRKHIEECRDRKRARIAELE
jgi:uncharacterized membrane protein YdbT with pleckstrin-like domain